MTDRINDDLTGMEPGLSRAASPLSGDEPALGGGRRIDPRILNDLSAGRWFAVERLRHQDIGLSPSQRASYARALVERLRALGGHQRPPLSRDPRGSILLVLGILSDPVALPSLLASLRDDNFSVRQAAIQGLGQLGDTRGVQPLLDLLDVALEDRATVSPFVVIDALGRLGKTDPDRVAPRLLGLLDSDIWPDLKLAVLAALGRTGDPRAAATLIRVLHTHSDFRHRQEAARALAHIHHKSVLPALVLALSDRYRDVRCAVAAALGYLGDLRAVQPLQMAYLTERVTRVRAGIERALVHLNAAPPGPDNPVALPWFGTFWHPDTPLET
jgi:HEAT repeat protein